MKCYPSRQRRTQTFLFTLAWKHLAAHHWVATDAFAATYRKLALSLPYPREPLHLVRQRLFLKSPEVPYDADWREGAYMRSSFHPESRPPGAPVRLGELCRCLIRERMAENRQLPHGVDSLRLPTSLKRFINFEEI